MQGEFSKGGMDDFQLLPELAGINYYYFISKAAYFKILAVSLSMYAAPLLRSLLVS